MFLWGLGIGAFIGALTVLAILAFWPTRPSTCDECGTWIEP